MAGDPTFTNIWLGGDAYCAPVGTTGVTDVTTAWPAAWKALGLLSDEAGLTQTREEDSNDYYAWGGVLVRTVRSKHKRTFTVTAIEDNDTIFKLLNPGSTSTATAGVTTRVVKVPGSDVRAFGFETRDGAITSRLLIPRGEVTAVGDLVRVETDLSSAELTVTVYPAADGTLFREVTNAPGAVPAA